MSIKNPTEFDLHRAALEGMDSRIDPEVAEDLGIPSTPEAFERHIAVGRDAKREAALTPQEIARQAADTYYTEQFGLTGADELTPEQQAINQAGRAAVSEAIADAKAKRV